MHTNSITPKSKIANQVLPARKFLYSLSVIFGVKMAAEVKNMFAKATFFFIVGVILASLFVWSMINGILLHLSHDFHIAFAYYFIAWVSGVAALTLYWQSKNLFHYAEISK